MILVIDVGNSQTVLGLMEGDTVRERWRISTHRRTTDEFGMQVVQLLQHGGWVDGAVEGVIVSCVVPSSLFTITKGCRRYLDMDPLVVGSGIRTGMRVKTDNPKEVGADRIVNAIAALEKGPAPLVVVDFGTATTFDCVDAGGNYVGGAIAPGLQISADALFSRTAKLPRVEVLAPREVIGRNTNDSIQSGLYYGYLGLVERLARECKEALGGGESHVRCIATGGFSNLLGRACAEVDDVDEHLTLKGLSLLWHRNAS
jgi:type III pantothenate kinase